MWGDKDRRISKSQIDTTVENEVTQELVKKVLKDINLDYGEVDFQWINTKETKERDVVEYWFKNEDKSTHVLIVEKLDFAMITVCGVAFKIGRSSVDAFKEIIDSKERAKHDASYKEALNMWGIVEDEKLHHRYYS